MITVRFPSGFSVQYNTATFLQRGNQYSDLYTAQGGEFIAQVPNDSLVEWVTPCRTYFAGHDERDAKIRALEHKLATATKRIAKLTKGTK